MHSIRRPASINNPEQILMKAYVIVQETVHDEAQFATYRSSVPATLRPYEGRFLVRGGELSVIEGEWPHPRLIVLEFPSRRAAMAWYRSTEYQAILPLRRASCESNLVVVDGTD